MPDEPTLGEVARRFEDRLTDVRDDIRQLGHAIDGKVSQEVYALQYAALMAKISALEALREKDVERLIATRRWLIAAVVMPIVAALLPVLISLMQGTGS